MGLAYRNIIVKLAILGILLFVVDFSLGKVLEHFYLKMKSIEQSRVSYSLSKSDEQIIVFGSSRANHHYIPTVFEDSLGLTAYNSGCDAQFILYHYCILENVLARKHAKVVILDLLPWEFEKGTGYDALSTLLPFYNAHKEIRPVVNLRSRYEKVKALSNLYRYNSQISTIIINNIFPKKDNSIKGYLPLYRKLSDPPEVLSSTGDLRMDTLKINFFKAFISKAKDSGVKVLVCVSPLFKEYKNTPQSINIAKKICADEDVSFIDYSKDSFFLAHPEYFQDGNHLNDDGAKIYSNIVCTEVKRITSK